jgi:hypothetical protein
MTTRGTIRVATAVVAIIAIANPAQAQTDARWRAWTGCWTPIAADVSLTRAGTVCVVPTERASAVEIVSVVGGKVADRSRIDADGAEHTLTRDGCTATQVATWSPAGTRLIIAETTTCPGSAARRAKSVMSFNQRYEWLDVRGISSGAGTGVAVARYQITGDTAGLPAEVLPAIAARGPAANEALLAASAPLTLADIADVAVRVDSGVAATWLMERTRDVKLTITGKQLAALADQGVPPAVIDVLVAIAHPAVFALNPATRDAEFRPQAARSGGGSPGAYPSRYAYCGMYWSPFYDPWFGDCGWQYGYGSYGYPYYGYYHSAYGYYGGFGYYSPYWGMYYPGSQPIVVVSRPSDDGTGTHGRVIKGRGYTSGGSGTVSRPSSGGSASSSGSSSGSSGGGSGSSAGSSSGSGSGGGRTAVRKPPQ